MKKVKLRCLECNEHYVCLTSNTKILGPVIETTCPNCKKETIANFGAFLHKQTKVVEGRFSRVNAIINMAKELRYINEDYPGFRKKRKRK
jgi:hypothetical protein